MAGPAPPDASNARIARLARLASAGGPGGATPPVVTYSVMVVVGTCELIFHLADNHSLKGKRQVSRSLVQRIRNQFNVSVAEVSDQDRWQTLSIGVSCVTDDARHANEILSKIVDYVEDHNEGAVLQHSRIEVLRT